MRSRQGDAARHVFIVLVREKTQSVGFMLLADMRSRRIYGDAQAACLAAFVEFMFKKKGMAFLYGKKPFLLTGQNIIYVQGT